MPCPSGFVHHPVAAAVLVDQIMGAHLSLRICQPVKGRLGGLHAGIVQQQNIYGYSVGPRVVVGEGWSMMASLSFHVCLNPRFLLSLVRTPSAGHSANPCRIVKGMVRDMSDFCRPMKQIHLRI